jgi:hypothetical protein
MILTLTLLDNGEGKELPHRLLFFLDSNLFFPLYLSSIVFILYNWRSRFVKG